MRLWWDGSSDVLLAAGGEGVQGVCEEGGEGEFGGAGECGVIGKRGCGQADAFPGDRQDVRVDPSTDAGCRAVMEVAEHPTEDHQGGVEEQ